MTTQTFTHKGIAIAVNDVGQFTATVSGKHVAAGSLATIKKKIDGGDTFKPFKALRLNSRYENYSVERLEIVGIENFRRRGHPTWVLKDGSRAYPSGIYLDTPENLKRLRAISAEKKRVAKLKETSDIKVSKLYDGLTLAKLP